jgi:hypothetical protein
VAKTSWYDYLVPWGHAKILEKWGESEGPLKYASPKRQFQSVLGDEAGERFAGFAGLDPAAFDQPKEHLFSTFPTYTTGRIANAVLGKPADEQTFWKNVGTGAPIEAVLGAAYFGGSALAGGAGGAGGGGYGSLPGLGGTTTSPGGSEVMSFLGLSPSPAGPTPIPGIGTPLPDPAMSAPYFSGAPGPGPYANPAVPEPAAQPSFLSRLGDASQTYGRAQRAMGGQQRPAEPPLPAAPPQLPGPGGPVNLTPALLSQALGGQRLAPPAISSRLLR